MKRFIVLAVMACILLTACAQQQGIVVKSSEETAPAEPSGMAEPPREAEKPAAAEEPKQEVQVEQKEDAKQEMPAEPAKDTAKSNLYTIRKGDKLNINGHSIEVYELLNSGLLVTFKIDGGKYLRVSNTKSPEIMEKLEFEIAENRFNKDSSIVMSIKPVELGKGEYLLYKKEYAAVNGTMIYLDGVKKSERDEYAWAYFSIPSISSRQYSVHEGASVKAGGFEISLLRAFEKYSEYAIVKIVEQ